MAFRKLKKKIQLWRLAWRRETRYVSYSLQRLVFQGREPAAKEIRRLHWRLGFTLYLTSCQFNEYMYLIGGSKICPANEYMYVAISTLGTFYMYIIIIIIITNIIFIIINHRNIMFLAIYICTVFSHKIIIILKHYYCKLFLVCM